MSVVSDFSPKINPWFNTFGEYVGPAEFHVEGGPLMQGQGLVTWDATGQCRIFVELAPASAIDAVQHGISDLRPAQFRLTTADGIFEAATACIANTNIHMGASITVKCELTTLAGDFTPAGAGLAKYWVAPLRNFISEAKFRSSETDNHPLRLFPTPVVGPEIPQEQRLRAVLIANSKNQVIPFEFEGEPAFIEFLPDFKEHAELLESGARQLIATSIVVGSLGSHLCSTSEEVKGWFPADLLFALSLASGAHVNAGFIEVRDGSAQLVKRFHISPVEERYEAGSLVINEFVASNASGSATGQLINRVLDIADEDKRRLIRVVIGHLVRAGLVRQGLENSFDHLVRGLEALTEDGNLSSQNLLDGVPSNVQADVKLHLRTAQTSIVTLANALRTAGDTFSADRLTRIADRAASADQKDLNFGLAVSLLLKKNALPDEEIVNAHYTTHPRSDGRSWAQVLSAYRGDVIHIGHLEHISKAALHDVYRYIRHLHDLLVRIILIEIGYTGAYQPTVSRWQNPQPANWVTANTSAEQLGYS